MIKRCMLSLALAFCLLATLPAPDTRAASGPEIDAEVNETLRSFFREVGAARELADKAVAMLVFPNVVKAGFGIGGEYGEGALRLRGRSTGYYNLVSASVGFQIGVQARSIILMFMTQRGLDGFYRSDGWEIGVDGSVALITLGVGGTIDTHNIRHPIVGFVFGSRGLMYNLTLEGSKISRIRR
ncbi:MAG: BPSL1445 family SYLF domain-containing lipoprotein [Methyloligellaceae bacterium]